MKNITTLITLIFLYIASYSQNLNDFNEELQFLENRFIQVFYNTDNIDDLTEALNEINSDVSILSQDIDDYISQNNDDNTNVKNLNNKIKNLESLTNERMLCDCYPYFKNLINNEIVLQEKNNVRVSKAVIGEFDLFFVYSRDNATYPISVSLKNKQGLRTTIDFFVVGNVVVVDIAKKGEKYLSKFDVGNRKELDFYFAPYCKYQYPRF